MGKVIGGISNLMNSGVIPIKGSLELTLVMSSGLLTPTNASTVQRHRVFEAEMRRAKAQLEASHMQ